MRQRAWIAGMTDYSGVSTTEIVEQFGDWVVTLDEDKRCMQGLAEQLKQYPETSAASEGIRFATFSIDVVNRLRNECDRLSQELPRGVVPAHAEAAQQLLLSAENLNEMAILFKQTWHLGFWTSTDPAIPIMAELYKVVCQAAVDMFDVSNIAHRLKALVGSPSIPAPAPEVIELRPNFMGLGVNLRAAWAGVKKWWHEQ